MALSIQMTRPAGHFKGLNNSAIGQGIAQS